MASKTYSAPGGHRSAPSGKGKSGAPSTKKPSSVNVQGSTLKNKGHVKA